MLRLRASMLRYTLGVFAIGLILIQSSAVLSWNPQGPNQPGQQQTQTQAPSGQGQQTAGAAQTPAGDNRPIQPVPQIEKMEPTEVARRGSVTFTGKDFPDNPDHITVFLNDENKGNPRLVGNKTSFIFAIPVDTDLGKYNVRVEFKLNERMVPITPKTPPDAMLTIYGEAGKTEPKITAVSPLLSYPEKEIYGFDVIGEGFSKRGRDNGLIIENRGEIKVCWSDDPKCQNEVNVVKGHVVNDRQITFSGIPQKHQGVTGIQARVGQSYSNVFPITLSRVSQGTPILVSLLIFAALFGLVLIATKRGIGSNEIAGKKYGLFTAMFLDKETDTYSLSRFQFFVWTAVAILSYLFLTLSRSLVQWKLEFVDIPAGLPGIILISASTTILAQGVTNSKGTKGAGEIHPSMADFISTGGLVVPERFQFFVWTVLGALVFLFLVFLNDPGTIKDLPQVPSGFLELMGISSLGYLGGKLARKSGPVIEEITATYSSLELKIRGRSLSRDARFKIGPDDIGSDLIEGEKPQEIESDPSKEPNMAKVLLLKIKSPKPEWLKDDTPLTIINPDGQKAVWPYKMGPVINQIQQEVKTDQSITLTVTGINLSEESKASLETADGKPLHKDLVSEFKDNKLVVTVPPMQKGESVVLVITDPDKRVTRKAFTVQ